MPVSTMRTLCAIIVHGLRNQVNTFKYGQIVIIAYEIFIADCSLDLHQQESANGDMEYSTDYSTSQESQGSELPVLGILHIVLEPAEIDLRNWLEINQDRQRGILAKMMSGACSGLNYLHGLSLVHRDLTPRNILISMDGRLMLSDFGILR